MRVYVCTHWLLLLLCICVCACVRVCVDSGGSTADRRVTRSGIRVPVFSGDGDEAEVVFQLQLTGGDNPSEKSFALRSVTLMVCCDCDCGYDVV